MICQNCQTTNAEDANFCLNCNHRISVVCPRCSRRVLSHARFCDRCSYPLDNSVQFEIQPQEVKPVESRQPVQAPRQAIVESIPELGHLAKILRHHHEHYDGRGYPDGLARDEIPLESRVIAVADAYEAMTARRPYRHALSHSAAVRRILEAAGTQFDPAVVAAFFRCQKAARAAKSCRPQESLSGQTGPEKEVAVA